MAMLQTSHGFDGGTTMGFDRFRPPFRISGIDPTWHGKGQDGAEGHAGDVAEHARWMTEALGLAHTMQGWVWPNPAVGCVIVRDGRIVGSAGLSIAASTMN